MGRREGVRDLGGWHVAMRAGAREGLEGHTRRRAVSNDDGEEEVSDTSEGLMSLLTSLS